MLQYYIITILAYLLIILMASVFEPTLSMFTNQLFGFIHFGAFDSLHDNTIK